MAGVPDEVSGVLSSRAMDTR